MSEMEPSPEPHLDENAQAGELACTLCQGEIYDAYFEVNGEASCQKCRYTVEDLRVKGSSAGRFFRASLAGSVAAVVGAGLYYAVLALTEYEFALVSILVGLMVGFAVNWGSGHRGGWLYQTLAVGLTYMAIVSTNVPFILDGWEDEIAADGISIEEGDGITAPASEAAVVQTEPIQLSVSEVFVGLAAFVLLVAAIPFFAGVENILGLLIIGFGLFEAWRLNRYQPLAIAGPFRTGQAHTSEDGPS